MYGHSVFLVVLCVHKVCFVFYGILRHFIEMDIQDLKSTVFSPTGIKFFFLGVGGSKIGGYKFLTIFPFFFFLPTSASYYQFISLPPPPTEIHLGGGGSCSFCSPLEYVPVPHACSSGGVDCVVARCLRNLRGDAKRQCYHCQPPAKLIFLLHSHGTCISW